MVVVVTHEMGFAREVADRVLFMEDGELLVGAPRQISLMPLSIRGCSSFYQKFSDAFLRCQIRHKA